jgi:hypothetical protein
MQRFFIAAMLLICLAAPVLAEGTFYIVYDSMMKGCTIVTTEPTDKAKYKVLGKYKSNAKAQKAIASLKEC